MSKEKCQLYLISPSKIEARDFCKELIPTLRVGNIACVQLRLKNSPEGLTRKTIEAILPITKDYGVPLILNDDPIMALETGCDGVHIGQEDTDYISARNIIGRDAIVGVTCLDSIDLAMRAADRGADYIAFGAFFPSRTKSSLGKPTIDTIKNVKNNLVTYFIDTAGVSTTWAHSGYGNLNISATYIPDSLAAFVDDSFSSLDQILDINFKRVYNIEDKSKKQILKR